MVLESALASGREEDAHTHAERRKERENVWGLLRFPLAWQ